MQDCNSFNQNEDYKLEKIHKLVEFEIQNAISQLSIYKKDNINLILLLLALIGFFALIPLDIFAYKWFEYAIIMVFMVSFVPLIIIIIDLCKPKLYKYIKKIDYNDSLCEDCESCDELIICKNLKDPDKREQIINFLDSKRIDRFYIIYSANNHCSLIYLLTAILAYFYCSGQKYGSQNTPIYESNIVIISLLAILFIIFILNNYQMKGLVKKKNYKLLYNRTLITSIIILFIIFIIEIYGNMSRIPPFVGISNSTQISIDLLEHSKNISSISVSLVIAIYLIILYLVLIEHFFTSAYLEKINKQLLDLLELKSTIDLYQIGLTSEIDINHIIKRFSKLKIAVPKILTYYRAISIPIPIDTNNFEEIIELYIDDVQKEKNDL